MRPVDEAVENDTSGWRSSPIAARKLPTMPSDRTLSRIRVGNLYVNRNQIGAVVGVQPFGGEGLSGTGPKAGGPHYLHRFANERTLSVDMTAAGGNASLLNLEESPDQT